MGEEQMGGNFAALGQRLGRIKTAVALGQPDRVPVQPFFDGIITRYTGGSYEDHFYNFEKPISFHYGYIIITYTIQNEILISFICFFF